MSRQLRKLQAADILAQPDSEEDKQPHISSSRPQSNLFDLLDDAAGDATETLDDIEPIANELKPATKQGRKKKKKKAAVTEKSLQPADDDDWESVLGQMADLSTACDQGTEESISQTKKIMNIEKVMLQAANEMAKRFGTRAPPLSRRIVVKKAQWPPFELGLSMTCDRVGQEKHFNIVHSQHYRDIQRAFLESISTHDPDSIYNVLTMHPYHLDALLCVSQILKPSNIDSAREMVERALFCIEQSFHTMYSLDSPLDYNKIENRSVYFVLSRHISFLSSQGCWRTSLEYSKWLLNLDHLDPLAAKLTIDFYAIKAREYSWFLTFQSLFPSNLPNALYSVAVATFEKELLLKSNHVKSTQLLHTAISKYPRVANLLADRLSIKECVQVNAELNGYQILLEDFYVETCHSLWKVQELSSWIKEAMQTVATVETSASVTGEVPISMKRMLFLTDNSAFLARLGTTMIMQHDPFPPETSIPSEYDEIMRPAVEENNTLSRISTLLQNGLGGLLPFFQQRPPVLEDSDSDDSD